MKREIFSRNRTALTVTLIWPLANGQQNRIQGQRFYINEEGENLEADRRIVTNGAPVIELFFERKTIEVFNSRKRRRSKQ